MSNSLLGLEGKKILILGGGQGMGESSAVLLARAGCDVALADLELPRAQRVAERVTGLGRKARAYAVDVTNDSALEAAIRRADDDMGGLDGMATIIGMANFKPLLDMSMDDWELDIRRNVRYFFLAAKTLAGLLIKGSRPGAMVCITSVDGLQSAPYHAPYGAAKAGLVNLVRSMSEEWAEHGIRINALAPGAIITPRIPEWGGELEKQRTLRIPMRRRGTTDEIGKGVLFLLSDLASYVTGHTLAVDGGFTAVGPLDYGETLRRLPKGGTFGLSEKK
ncbi:MAG TPA: SDR family NAD(P)-dependent oxidoreductase [Burkholderiales bacterium]|nr:SDR family NAD(P)-dependent oxidoreductase [Burkholderiales bacterium]